MNVQDASSPLRLLELHAVDLSDDDSNSLRFPPSPSTVTTVSSSSSSRSAHESDGAHVNQKSNPARTKELELGTQEEQQQQHTQHLTSYVLLLL